MRNNYINRVCLSKLPIAILTIIVLIALEPSNLHAFSDQTTKKINLNVTDLELKKVLQKIKEQTNYDFVYNTSEVNDKQKITIKMNNADITSILNNCFENSKISYVIKDDIIILKKKVDSSSKVAPSKQSIEKDIVLKGKLINSRREGITHATIILDQTMIGTYTDENGYFILKIPTKHIGKKLLFTYIGMIESSMVVRKSMNNIIISLKDDIENMGDIIVTGMESVAKDRMTGSTTTISAKDLKMQGATSIDRVLEGMVAGLNSTTVSGAPGTRAKITIRGENNLSSNTEPLWIVDGLPLLTGVPENNSGNYTETIMQDGIGNIMPNDIKSITVLKDASASAIYGARAANGVIIIETKRGYKGETKVEYYGTYEVGIMPNNNIDFMNSSEKLFYEDMLMQTYGINNSRKAGRGGYLFRRNQEGYLSNSQYQDELNRLGSYNTNWFNEIFRTAQSHSHNVSISGGADKFDYYTSISFQDKNGILMSNNYQNAGLLVKLGFTPNKRLNITFDVAANTRKNQDHASAVDPFTYAAFANPYERPYDNYGNYSADLTYLSNNYTDETASNYIYDSFNMINELENTRLTQTGLDATITLNIKYELLKGLNLQSIVRQGVSYNMSTTEINEGTYTSWSNDNFVRDAYKEFGDIFPSMYDNGELKEGSGRNNNWAVRNQINFERTFNKDHFVSVFLANEIMSKKFNNFDYTSPMYYSDYRITGVPDFSEINDLTYKDMYNQISSMFNTSEGQDRSVSFIASTRYSYKNKYVVNFSYRADGADIIGEGNRFTPLWSIGLRYNLHNERFFKNNIVSGLSIRGSYGYTGNIDRSAYPFSTISYSSDDYLGDRYANSMTYANPTVGWEHKQDRNIGLDLSLFENKINFAVDYYYNRMENILESLDIPNSTGRTKVIANGGVVENKGVEFTVNMRLVNKKDFNFSISANLAFNKNVIIRSVHDYDSYKDAISSSAFPGGVINIVGEATGGIYGWKTAGVNPITGNPRFYLTDDGKKAYSSFLDGWDNLGSSDKSIYAPFITDFNNIPNYIDYIKDASIAPDYVAESMQYLGTITPKLVGGFSTNMNYKGFNFTTAWTYKIGHLIPTFNDYKNAPNNSDYGSYVNDLNISSTNREKKHLNLWQAKGDITEVSRYVSSGNDNWTGRTKSSDYEKGDYLRLTNIALNYNFNSSIAERLNIGRLTVGINARNLLTFTKYSGLDVGSNGSFTYPVGRELSVKVIVGF